MDSHDLDQPAAQEFIAGISKVELHLHLEGSVEPDLLARLCAGRRRLSRRDLKSLYDFKDFAGFLEAYRRAMEEGYRFLSLGDACYFHYSRGWMDPRDTAASRREGLRRDG